MNRFNLLFLITLVSCGSDPLSTPMTQQLPADSSLNEPENQTTFDFKNHRVVYQSFGMLSEVIRQHQPLYLKLSVSNAPERSLYLGKVDSLTPLDQLRLHIPTHVEHIDYKLFNSKGFTQSGTIIF